jgi:hypothetical protein
MSSWRAYPQNVSTLCRPFPANLTLRRIQFLRDAKEFMGTSFKIVSADPSEPSSPELLFSCLGAGYVNVNRSLA